MPLPESDVAAQLNADGFCEFTGNDIQHIGQAGEPSIPYQSIRVLLPPNADLTTVRATIIGSRWGAIDGDYDVKPVPPLAVQGCEETSVVWPAGRNIVNGRDADIYESDALFPLDPICKVDVQVMRGWKMAQILYAPFAYNPVEKQVLQLSGDAIEITFERTSPKGSQAGVDLTAADKVRESTVNFAETSGEYGGYAVSADTGRYVIITTGAIQAASENLTDFVASKEARGFTVQVVTEGTWGGGTGDTAAENLRSWLQANYISLNIKYVLLIGNPNPSTGDVPMKMCYPQEYDLDYPDCPTDFYYAELTSNDWDKDGDGLYGEYLDDFSDSPPRAAEVAVGRIPYYDGIDDIGDLDHILAKIIDYENAPAASASWRTNVLLPMYPSDFPEPPFYYDTPAYHLGEEIKNDVLPGGWTYHRVYHEDYGLDPVPETVPCTVASVTDAWNGSDFGAVFWWTHGEEITASHIMDLAHAATLDDDHPGFTFQCSCKNGWPEASNNLGYSLLKNGCIATVSASRNSWYEIGQTSFAGSATNSGMAFEYASRLIDEEMYAGDALNDLKWGVLLPPPSEEDRENEVLWMNYLDFNLYGCPAVGLFTSTPDQPAPSVITYNARNVDTDSARLRANLTSLGTADSVTVSFEWGTASENYTYETTAEERDSIGTYYFDLGGLVPGNTYYYRAGAQGDGDPVYGLEKSFTTLTTPPSVTTNSADDITATSATLNGDLEDLGTADNVTVYFEWGLTTSYDNQTSLQPGTSIGLFSDNLTGLTANTTYHFRAVAVGDGTTYGEDRTLATPTVPPSVTTSDAISLTTNSARLNGYLDDLGTATSVSVSFQWGTISENYAYETAPQVKTATGAFSFNLTGLAPATAFYYRAKVVGDGTEYGEEKNFITSIVSPSVATGDVTNLAITSVRLNGSLSSLGTAASVSVSFLWGTTSEDYTYETTPETKSTSEAFYFDLSGLDTDTTFYYRAKVVGDGDPVYGLEKSFTTGIPPEVATLDASDLTFTSARLKGDLTSLGAADNVTVSFVWGVAPDWNNETAAEVKTAIGAFYFELGNLDPGTTYYYKAKAHGGAGPIYGDQIAFTTLAQPTVTTNAATNLTTTSARLNGALTSLGSAATVTISFQWGTVSEDYSHETTFDPKTLTGAFYFDLAGLNPGTVYYYRAKAEGDGGAVYGDQRSFATSVLPPVVTTGDATGVTASAAVLNANLVSLGTKSSVTVSFLWKASGGTYTETTSQAKSAAGAVFSGLHGLVQGTTYYYMVKAVGDGDPVYGDEMSFTTADGAPPVISMVSVSATSDSVATVTWTTNEPATSQVEYGLTTDYGSLTPLGGDLVESHSVRLTHLKAGRVYHYRVVSTDAAGNQAVSADGTFTTESRSGAIPWWLWIVVAGCVATGIVTLAVLLPAMRRRNQTGAVA